MTLRGSAEPLCRAYDLALLDLDGVVYVGDGAVPGAPEAIAAIRAGGMRVAFVTNNASRTPEVVAAHLGELGVPAGLDDVVTAAQATARRLAERLPSGAPVLVVGGAGLVAAVEAAGLQVVRSAADAPVAVAQGLDPGLRYADLVEAAVAVRAGAWWVAANLDPTLPTPRGEVPGNGAFVAAVAAATGRRPESVGKPERALYDEAVRRTGAKHPLAVGDRLDTDVAGATAAGCDSLLVLSGVATVADLAAAPPDRRPAYLGADVGALLVLHPAPVADGDGMRCGDARATFAGGRIRAEPAGRDGLDPVRAAVALVWRLADAGEIRPAEGAEAVAAWAGVAGSGREAVSVRGSGHSGDRIGTR